MRRMLDDVTVLDAGHVLAGPLCTDQLAIGILPGFPAVSSLRVPVLGTPCRYGRTRRPTLFTNATGEGAQMPADPRAQRSVHE